MDTLAIIGALLAVGHYVGLQVKRIKLPSLVGHMLLGVLMGSSFLGILGHDRLEDLGFVTEIALGFVAFSIGLELSLTSLKRQGSGIISVIFAESFGAFLLTAGAIYALTKDAAAALVFGAMAPASAPAGTVAVIQEYKAKGSLTKALYAVVGFDDGLAIIIFGFASAMAKTILARETMAEATGMLDGLLQAGRELGLSLLVGAVLGAILCVLLPRTRDKNELFILTVAAIMAGAGISRQLHLSLILTNMVIGFTVVNRQRGELVHAVSRELMEVMPLLFMLFFTLAGAHLELRALSGMGLVGCAYILARSGGLMGGARLGAWLGNAPENVRKYIGLGILSQAGVAIGLAVVVGQEFAELGSPHAVRIATSVLSTITATCIFFELIGPILTKYALTAAGEIRAQ